jgi:hypothetical protein
MQRFESFVVSRARGADDDFVTGARAFNRATKPFIVLDSESCHFSRMDSGAPQVDNAKREIDSAQDTHFGLPDR